MTEVCCVCGRRLIKDIVVPDIAKGCLVCPYCIEKEDGIKPLFTDYSAWED